uniref:ATP synthase subunit 8 n=1 Tax=Artemia franciscana TaxID=6661 RepID=A0A7U0FPM4_ARTSF|nr:ATP synthase subunit 8 [Artemia franciscana]
MPQMMPLPWVAVFFTSAALLWVTMALLFFLYQPLLSPPLQGSAEGVASRDWKW